MVRLLWRRARLMRDLTARRVSFVFAIQSWLQETEETKKTAQTPGYFSVLMSSKPRFSCAIHKRRLTKSNSGRTRNRES